MSKIDDDAAGVDKPAETESPAEPTLKAVPPAAEEKTDGNTVEVVTEFHPEAPLRRRRILRYDVGEGEDKFSFFIREFSSKEVFGLSSKIKMLAKQFYGKRDDEEDEDSAVVANIERILGAVEGFEADAFALVTSCVFKDKKCEQAIEEDDIATAGELAMLLRAIWEVNAKTLKKAIGGLTGLMK